MTDILKYKQHFNVVLKEELISYSIYCGVLDNNTSYFIRSVYIFKVKYN